MIRDKIFFITVIFISLLIIIIYNGNSVMHTVNIKKYPDTITINNQIYTDRLTIKEITNIVNSEALNTKLDSNTSDFSNYPNLVSLTIDSKTYYLYMIDQKYYFEEPLVSKHKISKDFYEEIKSFEEDKRTEVFYKYFDRKGTLKIDDNLVKDSKLLDDFYKDYQNDLSSSVKLKYPNFTLDIYYDKDVHKIYLVKDKQEYYEYNKFIIKDNSYYLDDYLLAAKEIVDE